MIAADRPVARPTEARLLIVDAGGNVRHATRGQVAGLLRAGDLVVANDAATLPASLTGEHVRTGNPIEVRLAGWSSRPTFDVSHFAAVAFGAGDYRTKTEHRRHPPIFRRGDRLALGPLSPTVVDILGHPRLLSLKFRESPDAFWAGLARHGKPIQYSHVPQRLALWDVWTPIAGPPVAFEPPSAGFALTWGTLADLHDHGFGFVTITHAAGISSTGDDDLDRRLPLDEPYEISEATARAIDAARARGGRVIAVGTTVVRALEHAAIGDGGVRAGGGLATGRIGPASRLTVADAILTGIHEPGSSHYELLRAFTDDATLARANDALAEHGYRHHEFGDSVLIERQTLSRRSRVR